MSPIPTPELSRTRNVGLPHGVLTPKREHDSCIGTIGTPPPLFTNIGLANLILKVVLDMEDHNNTFFLLRNLLFFCHFACKISQKIICFYVLRQISNDEN